MKTLTAIVVGVVGVMLFAPASSGVGQERQDAGPPQIAGTYIGHGVSASERDGPSAGPVRMLVRQDGAEITATLSIIDEDNGEVTEFEVAGVVDADGFVFPSAEPIFDVSEDCGSDAVSRIATLAFRGSQALVAESYITADCGRILVAATLIR